MKRLHTHKYERRFIGRKKDYEVFVCQIPRCTHYVEAAFIVGRQSICWVCGDEFVVFKPTNNPVPKRPHCRECTRKRDKSHVKPVEGIDPLAILDELD